MNRKESIEIAEREFSSIVCDGPFSIREQVIPLLADKIMEIEKLKKEKEHGDWLVAEVKKVGIGGIEVQFKVLQIKNTELQQKLDRVLGLDYYEEICIPWYQKYCHNSGRLKPLSDMIQKKIQQVVGDKNV